MKEIEFKNLEYSDSCIAADLYLEGRFIVRLSVNSLIHLLNSANTNIGLYEFFRKVMIKCVTNDNLYHSTTTMLH